MRRERRNLWMTLGTACNRWTTLRDGPACGQRFLESGMNDSPPLRLAQCNLILARSNRLVSQDRPTRGGKAQTSASRWAFPLWPDGGRKDSKVTRFVEMEWATRVAVDRPPRTVLTDESADLARQASTHAAITHRNGKLRSRLVLDQHVEQSTHGHLSDDVSGTAPASVGAASRPGRKFPQRRLPSQNGWRVCRVRI